MQNLELKKDAKEKLRKVRETQIAYSEWRKGQGGKSPRPSEEEMIWCEEVLGSFLDAVLEDRVEVIVHDTTLKRLKGE